MTIANAWCTKDQAWVMSDSVANHAGNVSAPMSKLCYVSHSNLVLNGQGQGVFVATLALRLQFASATFDEVVEEWGDLIAEVRSLAVENRSPYVGPQNVLLVGYSEIAGRFRALMTQIPAVDAKPLFVTQSQWVLPWEREWEDFPPAQMRFDTLRDIARYQIRKGLERGATGFGGPVLLAQMTREQTTIRSLAL